jgi:ferredoxin
VQGSAVPTERVKESLDTLTSVMRVWIDQDLCTGDGLCLDHCPDVFVQLEDGIAYVAEAGSPLNDPGGSGSLAVVPERDYRAVIDAAEACPGECIFIEISPANAASAA